MHECVHVHTHTYTYKRISHQQLSVHQENVHGAWPSVEWASPPVHSKEDNMETKNNSQAQDNNAKMNDNPQVKEALRELTEERGYRDATELVKNFYLSGGQPYPYFCTLQTPSGSPIYCHTPKKVLRILDTARKNNETNESRTAKEPIDSPPWTLVGNFDIDDLE